MSNNIDTNTASVKADVSTVALSDAEFADQLEAIAREIEQLHIKASLQIGERLAKAQDIFRYRRDEGGFTGWIEHRLKYSTSTAYRLIDAYKRFGNGECFPNWETLPVSALYLLAPPSVPQEAFNEVAARVEAGEKLSCAAVSETIARQKAGAGNVVNLRDWKTGEETVVPADDAENDLPPEHHDDDDGGHGDVHAGGHANHNGDDQLAAPESTNKVNGAATPTIEEADSKTASRSVDYLHEVWGAATDEEQAKIIQNEPVDRLVSLMSDAQRTKLFDQIVSQQIASPAAITQGSNKLLTNLTGNLHWGLGDPANRGAACLKFIATRLSVNKRDPKDVRFAFAKREVRHRTHASDSNGGREED
jgi:hypothetical protein